ncbi:transposase [Nocardiopsis sp. NPDC006198]|uniref:transposase n=1 Tax=Nocardiopsis sp. NPDC006198 TaxID=3154472 RepID=UPI0033A52207
MRPPRGRTWAPRGRRPLVRVRGRGTGRVNVAGVLCYRPGDRSRFFYVLHLYRGRWGEPKAFSWRRYRMTHLRSGAPVVWCWDNLNVHLTRELTDFAAEHQDWLRIVQLPRYAPELNPAEGVWSLLTRYLADFAAADLAHLTRVVKRKLKKIPYRPHLIDGCLPPTGLTMEPDTATPADITSSS